MARKSRNLKTSKTQSSSQKLIVVVLSALATLIGMLLNHYELLPAIGLENPIISHVAQDDLQLDVIDVGQADCLLITSAKGETMLIDAGNRADEDIILSYLEQKGISHLNYVIATHPHEDHIGSMAAIINKIPIDIFYLPDATHTTSTYNAMIEALELSTIDVREAYAGVQIPWQTGKMEFVAPRRYSEYKSLNNYSAVILLQYGKTNFLFCGDAEKESEEEILATYSLPQISILKTGHHGSSTSSSSNFLGAIRPTIALICCGENNDYGHPHRETLQNLNKIGSKIYRSDLHGHIIITSDGDNLQIQTQKE